MSTSKKVPAPVVARKAVVSFVTAAIDEVDAVLNPLPEGEKVSMEQICASIAEKHGLKSERVYPFVSMYLKNRSDVTVVRGNRGGVFKGARPLDPKAAAKLLARAEKEEQEARQAAERAAQLRARAQGAVAQA